MNKHITLRRMKNAIKYFVDETPDFVYNSEPEGEKGGCFYIKKNQPSCLIGKALNKLGVAKAILKELDCASFSCKPCSVDDSSFIDTLRRHDWSIDPSAIHLADSVQVQQDGGEKWSCAYEKGLANLNE